MTKGNLAALVATGAFICSARPVSAGDAEAYAARNKGKVSADCLKKAKDDLATLEKGEKGLAKARKGLESLIPQKCSDGLIEARIGLAYLDDDTGKAKAHLEAASGKIAADYPDLKNLATAVHFNLAYLYEQGNEFDTAEKGYRAALELDPAYENARTSLETLYQKRARARLTKGDTDGALKDAEAALKEVDISEKQFGFKLRAVREQISMLALETLIQARRDAETKPYIDGLVADKNTKALMNVAQLYWKAHNRPGQEQTYKTVFEIEPTNADSITLWGELYETDSKLDEAADIYRNALAKNPKLPQVKYALGVILFNQGKSKEGIELVEQAARELPKAEQYQDTLAEMNTATKP